MRRFYTSADIRFIQQNSHLNIYEIGARLKRGETSIRRFVKKNNLIILHGIKK